MKALTLTAPWSTLVAIGAKTIETRDWATAYRGDLLITASKKFPADCRALVPQHPFASALGLETLHTGKALCVVELYECFKFDDDTLGKIVGRSSKGLLPPFEYAFGDYSAGRAGLVFRNLRVLNAPIPCRGSVGLWKAPPELAAEVRRQLDAHEHKCDRPEDGINHTVCRCWCGATALNTMNEAEWTRHGFHQREL